MADNICPKCGTRLKSETRFCGSCGSPVASGQDAQPQAARTMFLGSSAAMPGMPPRPAAPVQPTAVPPRATAPVQPTAAPPRPLSGGAGPLDRETRLEYSPVGLTFRPS